MSERYFEPSAMDSYFEKQGKPTVFLVLGKEVIVDNERLATAMSRLPQLRREVLLLYYFAGYRDEAIGRLYRRCRKAENKLLMKVICSALVCTLFVSVDDKLL